ncbi:MAG: alpha-amylase family glycosyl hydrolase [Arachnia sp.]
MQLFQWPWASIAAECGDVLGPQGIGWVLTSPPQEHITGEQWWTSYQPVSYRVESKLGTRDEFADMVSACHEAGVEVYADAVINHMAGVDGGTGYDGSSFSHYGYPGIYEESDFHHCGLAPEDDIADYQDRAQVQTCELSNLADLDTSSEQVRRQLADYLNDLLSLGVDGFRIDAAKHVSADDLAAILDGVNGDPVVILEVIPGGGEPVQPEDYLELGGVFAFHHAKDVAGVVRGGSLRLAADLGELQIPSDQAYTFVTNHDTERSGQSLTPAEQPEFTAATALMLTLQFGTPVLYSGYAFDDRDAGAVSDSSGAVAPVYCPAEGPVADPEPGQWTCGHRDLLGLVRWRNVVGDAPIGNLVAEPNFVIFERGERGLVAISTADEAVEVTFETALPDGSYCDALTGASECSEPDHEIADGQVQVTVPAGGVVALHINLRS